MIARSDGRTNGPFWRPMDFLPDNDWHGRDGLMEFQGNSHRR